MLTVTSTQRHTAFRKGLDQEEQMMLDRMLSKIKNHVDRNIENCPDTAQASRLMAAKWFLDEKI